ncbi:MAG: pantetheine-phosphate adenylyltransferase [bacterium]
MRVIYTGSFDPVTNGHFDIISRASRMFDDVIVAIMVNPSKVPFLPIDDRCMLINSICSDLKNVNVVLFTGLTVECAKLHNADTIIRGIRNDGDLTVEMNMARINSQLSGIETIFLPGSPEYAHISSSMVREIFKLGGDISSFVPAAVANKLNTP